MREHTWSDWRRDRGFWLICLTAILLGLIYNGVILRGFGPDEPRHMNYVKLLLDEQRFPFQVPGGEYRGAHTYHPPLYYLLLLPFYALLRALPGESEWHVLRLVSLALCVGALPFIYQIAQRAGNQRERDDRTLARLTVAGVALLPIFGMTGGIINNDSALLLAVTVFLWLLIVKFPHAQNWQSAVVLGVCFGLGALCKATALLCNGVALLAYLWVQGGRAGMLKPQIWLRFGLVLLIAACIAGPWYARNIALYGTYQPIPMGYTHAGLPGPSNGVFIMTMHPNFPILFAWANWGIFYTLWAQRDWLLQTQSAAVAQAPLQPIQLSIYLVLAAYTLIAAVGHIYGALAKKRGPAEVLGEPESRERRMAVWVPYAAFGVAWLACLHVALFVHWGQAEGGRYLLPALCAWSLFLARGWAQWLGARGLKVLWGAWCLFCLALNGICIYWLLSYLNPQFGPPHL